MLIKTELFSVNDIKSRVFKDEVFLVGVGQAQAAYIHLKLYLLDGRADAQKQGLVEGLLRKLEQQTYFKSVPQFPIQLCVEMIDIPKQNYFKAMISP